MQFIPYVLHVVNQLSEGGCTVTLCALDISKAFDRVNFYGLLNLLMDRAFPKCMINLLLDWLTKGVECVRWAGSISTSFHIFAGVRQGGLLSPMLFAVYMDNLISRLRASGLGCNLHGVYYGCLVYADDVMLISRSVTVMQRMLAICDMFAVDLDVKFNTVKSVAIRIGKRYKVNCADLTLSGNKLVYVQSVKYLGVYIKSAKHFKCTYEHVKIKFFRAFNAIYSKSKASRSELVSVELLKSYCLPTVLYATETSGPTKQDVNSLNNCINLAVMKIFGVRSTSSVTDLRLYLGLTDLHVLISNRAHKFIENLSDIPLFGVLT